MADMTAEQGGDETGVAEIRDSEEPDRSFDDADCLETIEGIRLGLEDMRNGRVRPAAEVFAEMRRELGIA